MIRRTARQVWRRFRQDPAEVITERVVDDWPDVILDEDELRARSEAKTRRLNRGRDD